MNETLWQDTLSGHEYRIVLTSLSSMVCLILLREWRSSLGRPPPPIYKGGQWEELGRRWVGQGPLFAWRVSWAFRRLQRDARTVAQFGDDTERLHGRAKAIVAREVPA